MVEIGSQSCASGRVGNGCGLACAYNDCRLGHSNNSHINRHQFVVILCWLRISVYVDLRVFSW